MLPADLRAAEAQAFEALLAALEANRSGRWSLEWRFEGLRLMPVALRLLDALNGVQKPEGMPSPRLLFPDAGATALAQRDCPASAQLIASFGDQLRRDDDASRQGLLLACSPAPSDYDTFERVCQDHRGAVVMLNGSLEDAAVGIGSVARERRRGFLATWQSAYALVPLDGAALRRAFPRDWELYAERPEGYGLCARFEHRPDAEQQAEALGKRQELGGMEAFLEELRR